MFTRPPATRTPGERRAGLTKAAGTLEDGAVAVRLWAHEALRVFHDRLTDDGDRVWLGTLLCEVLETHFGEKGTAVFGIDDTSGEALIGGMRGLLFGDFMVPGADPKPYKCAAGARARASRGTIARRRPRSSVACICAQCERCRACRCHHSRSGAYRRCR